MEQIVDQINFQLFENCATNNNLISYDTFICDLSIRLSKKSRKETKGDMRVYNEETLSYIS